MKDLIITFRNENGETIKKTMYDRVFDFTEEIEENGFKAPSRLKYKSLTAQFFENRTKNFTTIGELYKHCIAIMK